MNDILHSNIFFFITSVAVIIVTVMFAIVLWYVIVILKEIKKITTKVSKASEGLERDFEYIRSELRSGSSRVSSILTTAGNFFLGGFLKSRMKPPHIKKRKSSETDTRDSV